MRFQVAKFRDRRDSRNSRVPSPHIIAQMLRSCGEGVRVRRPSILRKRPSPRASGVLLNSVRGEGTEEVRNWEDRHYAELVHSKRHWKASKSPRTLATKRPCTIRQLFETLPRRHL
jgi:hypothetical protein